MRRLDHPFGLLLLTAVVAACADAPPTEPRRDGAAALPAALPEKRLDATVAHTWAYGGLLPSLDDWQVTLSLAGHTARIEGALPAGFTGRLPYYAVPTAPGPDGRARVTVVYPISTARLVDEAGRPTGNRNAGPGQYPAVYGVSAVATDAHAAWGGFPYLEFDPVRHLALHGPITDDGEGAWRLERGPVSHGCARMQGEHIVELAHLMGFDLTHPEPGEQRFETFAPDGHPAVTVLADFDRVDGQVVDVDYPGAGGFHRPTGPDVTTWPTWSTDDFPRFVCAVDAPPADAGEGPCESMPDTGRNPLREAALGEIACPAGYEPLSIGVDGGRLCSDGRDALGPFTMQMTALCRQWGGGDACGRERWSLRMALRARGDGVCPAGAELDARGTAYCVEGENAFGPFPPALVARCKAAGGGHACDGARWRLRLLDALL